MDVALFDGTADYLMGGDVADLLDKPVEILVVVHRTGGNAAIQGFFGKSRAAHQAGRFGIVVQGVDALNLTKTEAGTFDAHVNTSGSGGTSTNLQVLHGHGGRDTGANQATGFLRRNGVQIGAIASPRTDTGASVDTTNLVMVGALQSTTGGAPPYIGSYLTGYIGECAKWSVAFSTALRLRLEHSRQRKWRING
jgi:hypothetical protein